MFNIIETPRNYFTRELIHDNLSSNVALHLLQHNVALWLIVIAFVKKLPMKILAKISSKLCIIFYNIFKRKSRNLLSIFGKIKVLY